MAYYKKKNFQFSLFWAFWICRSHIWIKKFFEILKILTPEGTHEATFHTSNIRVLTSEIVQKFMSETSNLCVLDVRKHVKCDVFDVRRHLQSHMWPATPKGGVSAKNWKLSYVYNQKLQITSFKMVHNLFFYHLRWLSYGEKMVRQPGTVILRYATRKMAWPLQR